MPKRTRFHRSDMRRLISGAAAFAKDAREICGVLIDNGHFLQIRETRNISKERGSSKFDRRELNSINRAAEKLELKVVGTFHSHPFWFAKPGESDIQGAVDNSLMLIIDGMDKQVGLWRIKNNRGYALTFELI